MATMTSKAMPAINIDSLEGEAREYALAITVQGADGLRVLRASKPTGKGKGRSAYVWRMVAFTISPNPRHQCMPMTADFDLAADLPRNGWSEILQKATVDHDELRAECGRLDKIVDAIIAVVPKSQWAGVVRWGQALGIIGTPRVGPDGAIIYR